MNTKALRVVSLCAAVGGVLRAVHRLGAAVRAPREKSSPLIADVVLGTEVGDARGSPLIWDAHRMTRMVRALVLLVLGALLVVLGVLWWSALPEMTMENVDELSGDRTYRLPGVPLGLGVGCILSSAWLAWRQSRVGLLRREYPGAVFIEVTVSKEAKRELASVFLTRGTPWSYILLVRDNSISLWAGLPPVPEIFVETAALRAFEYEEGPPQGPSSTAPILLEWIDGETHRRVNLSPIGAGLRGMSAPRRAVTLDAVQRGRELIGLEVAAG